MTSRTRITLLVAAMGLWAASAHAGTIADWNGSPGYAPRVPVSALARPAAWFDPSRLQVSTMVSVGSGGGGRTNALQTTSFRYDFGRPLSVNVSLGNAWGSGMARNSQFFLESLDVGYRPFESLFIRVQYRDIRSPLQVSSDGRYPLGTPFGY